MNSSILLLISMKNLIGGKKKLRNGGITTNGRFDIYKS